MPLHTPESLEEMIPLWQQALDAILLEGGHQTRAARSIGIPRTTLIQRIHAAQLHGLSATGARKRKEAGAFESVKSDAMLRKEFRLTGNHKIGMISDSHIPYHDVATFDAAINYFIQQGCDTLAIVGDFVDLYRASKFEQDPRKRAILEETAAASEQLGRIRSACPDMRMLLFEGNHEKRMTRYIWRTAPEFSTLGALTIPHLLEVDKHRVEWIGEQTRASFGKLDVLHLHQYNTLGINMARNIWIRAAINTIGGHGHRSQAYVQPNGRGEMIGVWTMGCTCSTVSEFAIRNQWVNGGAIVETDETGAFHVQLLTMVNGYFR